MKRRKGRRGRVTLADVAERAGVSVPTVSLVLSGRTDTRIPTSTADRVRQAASVLNYRALPRAIAPLPTRLPVVGFVTDTAASDHFVGEMIGGAIARAAAHGHALFTADTERDPMLERRLVDSLVELGVERFVYAAMATRTTRLSASFEGRTVVLLNCLDRAAGVPAIVPDEAAAGALASTTLLDAGHTRRIWLVGEVRGQPYAGRERREAIVSTLRARGLRLARHLSCEWWPPAAREAMSEALTASRGLRRPSAVIAMNDRVALGIYQAAGAAGLRIPEDLSVISFDNSDLAWWLHPALTSIGLPYYEMGAKAIDVLLGGRRTGGPELLTMPLHERDSVAPPGS